MVIVIPYRALLGINRPKRDSILPREYLSVFLFTERNIFILFFFLCILFLYGVIICLNKYL